MNTYEFFFFMTLYNITLFVHGLAMLRTNKDVEIIPEKKVNVFSKKN